MVVPALATLFSRPPAEELGDGDPFLGAVLIDELDQVRILLGGPGALYALGLEEKGPALDTLGAGAGAVRKGSESNLVPGLLALWGMHDVAETLIVCRGPREAVGAS
jgi:hypothetical protein